jgi:hypothetical protein
MDTMGEWMYIPTIRDLGTDQLKALADSSPEKGHPEPI